jgi:hypothetical protein
VKLGRWRECCHLILVLTTQSLSVWTDRGVGTPFILQELYLLAIRVFPSGEPTLASDGARCSRRSSASCVGQLRRHTFSGIMFLQQADILI